MPIRLRKHGHLVSLRLQNPRDDCQPKGRVIHIGIPGDIDKIRLFPAQAGDFLRVHGQKGHYASSSLRYTSSTTLSITRTAPGKSSSAVLFFSK